MSEIVLKQNNEKGQLLEAIFLPEQGMNLSSFKCAGIEVIDQSTKSQFLLRRAGLGALIGPHFHHRKSIPKIKNEEAFPHIAQLRSQGIQEPFSHGIARFAAWKAEQKENKISAEITGKDLIHEMPLAELEGQNFKMQLQAELTSKGLILDLSVVSDADSLVGIHYYYRLPNNRGTVVSEVQNRFIEQNEVKELAPQWLKGDNQLHFPLSEKADFTFHPFPNPLEATIHLHTEEYELITKYRSICQENGWQLYHPHGASFVCIEPVSAQDPRHPNLTVSSIHIELEIKL